MTEDERERSYRERLGRVLVHIETHLDEPLSLERLSAVAAFSKFHFHRQFSALYGLGVGRYVQLLRLRRASYRLAFRRHGILEVALASGYESHEAFSRAFKRAFGQTPSEFRAEPGWERWHTTLNELTSVRSRHMPTNIQPSDVEIVDFPETRVASLRHRGPAARLGDSLRRFIAWRRENGLPPQRAATFNIVHEGPDVPPGEGGYELCVAITRPVAPNDAGIVESSIPAGRCARLRHTGSDDTLPQSVDYLYATWLPASGEELRDFPLFFQRVRFFPEVPESEAVTDVFLPLR